MARSAFRAIRSIWPTLILLVGLMLALRVPAGLVMAPAFGLFLQRRFILREEVVIAAAFGPAYDRYRMQVRRWI